MPLPSPKTLTMIDVGHITEAALKPKGATRRIAAAILSTSAIAL